MRALAACAAIAWSFATPGAASADGPQGCDVGKAAAFRAAGDRYTAAGKFADGERWYFAATRYTRACTTSDAALLSARSLAGAGAALAKDGDYLRALDVLHDALSQLGSLAGEPRTAAAARPYLQLVQNMIAAINRVAEYSM
jgi:tetratricopeptide (TPR) repeat protein